MTVTTVPSTHPLAQRGPLSQTNSAEMHQSSDLQYQRREAHIPKSSNEDESLYILTLFTDKRHHQTMTALRRQWFPSHILKVDAHVTLFHALPGSKLAGLKQDIAAIAERTEKFDIVVGVKGVFEMGKGAGINVSNAGDFQNRAFGIRSELRDKWEPFLSDQDRREKWRGHYTIMNKQDDKEEVHKCLAYLKEGHANSKGTVEGLSLWLYDRGWWREDEVFQFSG
ncbi:hypothetical protein FPOAC2_06092 [Fusarium poae]|uniref:hypothetical protein n=1 Tax=Fusarium poae TaxID=36050 RepID=UPI001CE8DF90|nr:hypothetical protein FPOAC1_005975 [Fusarium poae]KAG8672694.1 hypothetical protein FPOAC1_005975 [Fusarium poae]